MFQRAHLVVPGTLRFIRQAPAAGFTLEEIRELLELDAGEDRSRSRQLARSRIEALEVKIADLNRARRALHKLATECEARTKSPCPNPASGSNEAPDLLSRLISEWDGKAPPPDRVLQARVEEEIAAGLAVPQWIWPMPGPYNGSSGGERIKGWQITKIALQRGWLDRQSACSICQSRQRVQRHSELYGRPLLCRPVCRECHFALHRRFRQPKVWQGICEAQPEDHWIRRLPLTELPSNEARQLEAQPNPLGLLGKGRLGA